MHFIKLFILLSSFVLAGGCASYQASSLTALDPQFVKEAKEVEGMDIGCKEFSETDCVQFLDRNLLKKGIQPIQLTFFNKGEQSYLFSTERVSLPCLSVEEVTKIVHTRTLGRVLGYTAGALLINPLLIPAVVDGIKSYKANQKLDSDFALKSPSSLLLTPDSFHKALLFVPKDCFIPYFQIRLINLDTNEEKMVNVHAN